MKRILELALALLLAYAFIMVTVAAITRISNKVSDSGSCTVYRPLLVTDDYYFEMGNGCVTFSCEADTAGSGTGYQVQTEHCTGQQHGANSCITQEFDTNHDNLPDTSVWTCTAGARGISAPWCGAGALHFNSIQAPDAGEIPEIVVCPKR